jgi:hypothetical protein
LLLEDIAGGWSLQIVVCQYCIVKFMTDQTFFNLRQSMSEQRSDRKAALWGTYTEVVEF